MTVNKRFLHAPLQPLPIAADKHSQVHWFRTMSDLFPATLLVPAVLETVGRWIAGYLMLSLSLALIWMALVTVGRLYRQHYSGNPAGMHAPSLPFSFRSWHRENDEFSRQLSQLDAGVD